MFVVSPPQSVLDPLPRRKATLGICAVKLNRYRLAGSGIAGVEGVVLMFGLATSEAHSADILASCYRAS